MDESQRQNVEAKIPGTHKNTTDDSFYVKFKATK